MEQGQRGAGCPVWCVAEHGDEERLEDRWHRGREAVVPVVERGRLSGDDSLNVAELSVLLERHVLDGEDWVTFGPGEDVERCFTVSRESAGRLARALKRAAEM